MLQLNPPLPRVVVAHPDWKGPVGKCFAEFLIDDGLDYDLVWVVTMNDTGECWCVPNRNIRSLPNITYGRTSAL